ncbi:MAG: hypothetical protein GY847_41595, partial [Proteobacteria bacterium]|nr:hypothetical protein [Pseudomonadota bacterium]
MTTLLSFDNENKETSRNYYPIFTGKARKAWTAWPLVTQGVESVQYSLIPGLLSAEIRRIKLLPRGRVPGTWQLDGDSLCQMFRRVGSYKAFLASGSIYHVELEFHLVHDPEPVVVLLSKPGIIVSTRVISAASRETIRCFLELVGICSRDELPEATGLSAFFAWMSKVHCPTMTERDFVDAVGKPTFDALKSHHIIEKYDIAKRMLCDRLKDHPCEQKIDKPGVDPSYPYLARCGRVDKAVPLCTTDVQRYTTSQSTFLNLLKRLFHIAGTLDSRRSVVADLNVTRLGRARWRDKDTCVYFCYKSWSSLLAYFLQNRLDLQENALVLTPSRWMLPSSIQSQYNSKCRVELSYLDEMLELKDGELCLVPKCDYFEMQRLRLSDIPCALVFDKHGHREVNRSEYGRIIRNKTSYDVYLNHKEFVANKYEGGVIDEGNWLPRHLSDLPAYIIANLIANTGSFMEPKVLCPGGEDGESARKAVERARR